MLQSAGEYFYLQLNKKDLLSNSSTDEAPINQVLPISEDPLKIKAPLFVYLTSE